MVSCILLSAGYSSRYGSPKALALYREKAIIELLQETLLASIVDEVIVVLGANYDQIKPHLLKHKKIKFVYNKNYNFGQTSSFKAGLQALADNTMAVILQPVDVPFICVDTINDLVNIFLKEKPLILIPTYEEAKGHPPIFSITMKENFNRLEDSQGINTLVKKYQDKIKLFPVQDRAVTLSFNTPEEFGSIVKQLDIS